MEKRTSGTFLYGPGRGGQGGRARLVGVWQTEMVGSSAIERERPCPRCSRSRRVGCAASRSSLEGGRLLGCRPRRSLFAAARRTHTGARRGARLCVVWCALLLLLGGPLG